jgi:hypothetical protein
MPTRSPKDTPTDDGAGHGPQAPAIPSFDSLRAPRRRSAMDLVVPGSAPLLSEPAERAAPRPPDYGDLVRLGLHVARVVAGVPARVALWSVTEPVRLLRRLVSRPGPVAG